MFIEKLIEKINSMENPTVAGLDTRLEYLPARMLAQADTLREKMAVMTRYNRDLIDALCDIIPAVKIQIAYYEMYGLEGMRAFVDTLDYAKRAGMLVIVDGKRNDIGATAEAYANAYLSGTPVGGECFPAFDADCLTVNPYLGSDGVEPFIQACARRGKGVFILVKTSNPSSGELQDMPMGDGRTLYQAVGDYVAQWGKDLIGACGYSSVGAVVGATYPRQGKELRERLKHVFFLVPGYGAQGASARDLAGCFDQDGGGALVNASRSLLCAWKKENARDPAQAARNEALSMRAALREVIRWKQEGN